MKNNKVEKSYLMDLTKIKETIRENRYKALVVVNSAMIMTYYKIGTIINERKEWGNKYILKLANDLKDKLLDKIICFLQELGPGFSLVGKEYKLVTPTGKNYYIDLLMYHVKIHAFVVIEVKIGEFQPSDIGQLHFYINAVNDLEKTDIDNPTIGILLCKNADNYVVKTSLEGIISPIGVSKYKMLDELPNYLLERMKEIE